MKPSVSPHSSVSRREFVSMLALAGAAVPLLGRAQPGAVPAAASFAPLVPAGRPTVHVFAKPMYRMSYAETASLIAECGFGGIDYTVRVPQGHVLPERVKEDLPRAVEAAHAEGLKVEMITTEITSLRDKHAETLLRTAASVGIKYYRLGNWNYDAKLGVMGTLEKIKPDLAALAALNSSLGMHGAIQNHAGTRVGGAGWDLYELLRDIDPRSLGVQYDIRHAVAEGGVSWPVGLKLLRPWIHCVDIKDFKWQQSPGKAVIEDAPLGEGIVPFEAYFKLLRSLEIAGPYSLHLEYPPFERAPKVLSADEQRRQFASAMKRDLAVLQGFIGKP